MQSQIMPENGHFSVGKTETLVKRDYLFEDPKTKVNKVVRNCILAERKSGKRVCYINIEKIGEHEGPQQNT